MSQWGNNDVASNSVIWAPAKFNLAPTRANANSLYGNTTVDAFGTGKTVGVYGVDTTEIGIASGNVSSGIVVYAGSGYSANAAVTLTVVNGGADAVVNAHSNSTGKIDSLLVETAGSGYKVSPTVAIAAPTNQSFNANSAVTAGAGGGVNSTITIATAPYFVANDPVTYTTAAGNSVISGLSNNTLYFIQFANSTVVALANTVGGDRITLTKGFTQTGHYLQGNTATGAVAVGGGKNKGVSHAGWVVRTVGTGGRAGRVQYETLVAMGSMASDGSDDSILPDA